MQAVSSATKSEPVPTVAEVVTPTRTEITRSEPVRPAPTSDLPVVPAMVRVAGGTFSMGSTEGEDDEKPIHDVQVSDFLMGKYELTVDEFTQFVEAKNYQTDAEQGDMSSIWTGTKTEKRAGVNWRYDEEGNLRSRSEYTHLVIHVSHDDAVAYCNWLSKRSGKMYRLPTEAEWKYEAGRGSTHNKYSWGNGEPSGKQSGNIADQSTSGIFSYASTSFNDGYKYTSPVGQYAPNCFGLYDMSGSVWEWCSDWYNYYVSGNSLNSAIPSSPTYRVNRGGSWGGKPQDCRVTHRNGSKPEYRLSNIGFRVVAQP